MRKVEIFLTHGPKRSLSPNNSWYPKKSLNSAPSIITEVFILNKEQHTYMGKRKKIINPLTSKVD